MTAMLTCLVALIGTRVATCQPAPTIDHGPELLVNGSFETDADGDGVPDGWRRNIQGDAQADVVLESAEAADGRRCIRIQWHSDDGAIQARLIQHVPIEPGKVYEIAYWYRSAPDSRLHADVLLTGTGPAYRNWGHAPTARWARKTVRFLIPEHARGQKPTDIGEVGEAAILVQNRGTVPIWYDGISFRETNLSEADLGLLASEVRLSPKSSDDSVIFPNTGKTECAFGVTVKAPTAAHDSLSLEVRLGVDGGLTPLGTFGADVGSVTAPVSRLPVGKSQLIAYLWDKQTGELLADHQQTLERFSPSEVPADIDLESAPAFHDKGKRFFPIGVFGFDPPRLPEQCEELKARGFNTIHSYVPEGTGAFADPAPVRKYLDMAQRYGFRTAIGMPRGIAESDRQPELVPWVREFGGHPTVLFFYTDEVVCIRSSPVSRVASLQRLLHEAVPGVPYIPYEPAETYLMPHVDGLIWGATTTRSEALVYRARLGARKPHIAVQHVDQNTLPPQGAEQEYRVFAPVIHGARGWFLFCWSWAKWNRADPAYFERMLTSVEHLAEVAPAVVSGEPLPDWTPTITAEEGSSALRCASGERVYFLLAPSSPDRAARATLYVPEGVHGRRMWSDGDPGLGPGTHDLMIEQRTVSVLEFRRTGDG